MALQEHFKSIVDLVNEPELDIEAIHRLGERLAQYYGGDSTILGHAQSVVYELLREVKGMTAEHIVWILSQIAIGFTEKFQASIENYQETQWRLIREKERLSLINDIGSEIAAVLDLDALFQRAATLVHEFFNYHHVAIFLVEGDFAILRAVAGQYAASFSKDHKHALDMGIIGWVARHNQMYLSNNVAESAEFVALTSQTVKTKSELCVPLKTNDNIVGLIDIQSPQNAAFDPGDVATLQTLADMLSVAITNAALHAQVQQELKERKQAELALRQSEQRYRHIVESQVEMICRFTVDGCLTFVNRPYAYYFDLEPHELIDRSIYQLVYKNDIESVRTQLATISGARPVVSYEHRVYLSDGSIGWHRWTARGFFNNQGTIIEIQAVGRDITQSKQIEEAMHRAQKLESLGILASGVAHDFNNLLTAIINESTLALFKLSSNPTEATQYIKSIISISEQAAGLTRQLLIYAGEEPQQLESIDLNELVTDVLIIAAASVSKRVTFKPLLSKELPTIDGDMGQVQQVVLNLIINAAESYANQPGVVKIRTFLDTHDYQVPQIIFEVEDKGCGMSKETLQRVFDPFFTTKLTGRGLGLAAVQGIVRGHHGDIAVVSELTEGTKFTVSFPVGQLHHKADLGAVLSDQITDYGKILVIEDDDTIRRSMNEMLSLKGFGIYTADNGA
ncbi:MAG: GAF domain-containing protein, partial [Anaerolineales bacterium]|nr:GAF domain-containing protein [Anaerolineales bacterium]